MRCRHAALRLAAALASVAAAAAVSALLDHRPLAALGVRLDARFAADVGLGVGVGALIVTAMTAAELACGWVRVHGVLESFDPSEKLSLNLVYDVLFHAAVSVNEELPMRGWLLLNAADALCAAFPAPSAPASRSSPSRSNRSSSRRSTSRRPARPCSR